MMYETTCAGTCSDGKFYLSIMLPSTYLCTRQNQYRLCCRGILQMLEQNQGMCDIYWVFIHPSLIGLIYNYLEPTGKMNRYHRDVKYLACPETISEEKSHLLILFFSVFLVLFQARVLPNNRLIVVVSCCKRSIIVTVFFPHYAVILSLFCIQLNSKITGVTRELYLHPRLHPDL